MPNNHFTHAPTVGSHDQSATIAELQARVYYLEEKLKETQAQPAGNPDKPPSKWTWKKFRKIFKDVVVPVLTFVPSFLNALARFTTGVPAR